MGASASTSKLTSEEVAELQKASNHLFSSAEIQHLYNRFQQLDRTHSGVITKADLELIPELSMNPLCHRILALFDTPDGPSDQITFDRFVITLSPFSMRASKEQKLKVAFQCYDIDGDGIISESDLFHVLRMLVGTNLTETQLQMIVAKTIAGADRRGAGNITYQEFGEIVDNVSSLNIQLELHAT